MRLIGYFDRGAGLHPERHCLHDGTRGWRHGDGRATATADQLKKNLRAAYWLGRERQS